MAGALLIASLPLAAQHRSRPSDSSDSGRTARDAGSSPVHSAPSAPSAPSYSAPSEPSSASNPPRTAQPRGSGSREPHRQPPSRGSRGNDGGGHHGGSHHGTYGGGYYYPYGGGSYGFWPGFWGGWWGGYYPYYYPYSYGQPAYYGREGSGGALDLDVAPGRTEVYVDGQYLGKVDAFDGWPRYLWLPKGTYDVVLYLDGYKTIARQITVYPGTVIGIDDQMEPGDSVRPEDLASKTHDRRDDRTRYERERGERIDRGERGDEWRDNWRDRIRRDRGDRDDRDSVRDRRADADDDDDDDADVEDIDVPDDTSSQKGRLRLEVEPEDASVYLDGRFVGTGTDLALMRGGLPVTPGDHRLAVVRPGRKAEERRFEVKAGEDVELEIELDGEGR